MAEAMAGLDVTAVTATEIVSDSNVWGIHDYVKAIAVLTLLIAIVVGVARTIINLWPKVPVLQKIQVLPFPIIQAIPPAGGHFVADNDIDDALARSPLPSRNHSPLPWLPEIIMG